MKTRIAGIARHRTVPAILCVCVVAWAGGVARAQNGADAAAALTNKLVQILSAGGGVTPNSFISIVAPGIPIDPSHMAWATKPPPYSGDNADDAAAFASIVNTIPSGIGPWAPGTADLADTYRNIFLANAMLPDVLLTPQQQDELDKAYNVAAAWFGDYLNYWVEWVMANSEYQNAIASGASNVWLLGQVAKSAMTKWKLLGHKVAVETALAKITHFEGLGLQNAKSRLIEKFDGVYYANTTNGGANFVPASLYPGTLFDTSAKWNKFTLKSSEFKKFANSQSSTYVSDETNKWLFWWWDSETSGWSNSKSYDINTSDLTVSFEYLRVHIDRSQWFSTGLLMSNAWWWPGATQSNPTYGGMIFSDGQPPSLNQGEWQMIPSEVLLVRNVRVNAGSVNIESQSWESGWTQASEWGFWIFHLGGSSQSDLSSGSSYHTTIVGNTITAKQPQIAAFICQLMPKEPNPALSLLPLP